MTTIEMLFLDYRRWSALAARARLYGNNLTHPKNVEKRNTALARARIYADKANAALHQLKQERANGTN